MSDLILINGKIDILNKKLDKILLIIENNSINCKKMGDHISFIEEVYDIFPVAPTSIELFRFW